MDTFINTLIYVDIVDEINMYGKNILKYLYFKLPFILINNNINECSIFFVKNKKNYRNLEIKYLYYYLMKNSFIKNINRDYDNKFNSKIKINKLIIINNYKKNYVSDILNHSENNIFLNLNSPSIKNNFLIKFNYLTYGNIDYLCKFSFEKSNFVLENINNYPFIDYIIDDKVKQHYNRYLDINNNNKIFLDNITKQNIKKNNKKSDFIINKENKINIISDNISEINDESIEFFKSSISLSDYFSEIYNNSFLGIMVHLNKKVKELIFIPHLINTKFNNELISYSDFLDLRDNKIDELINFSFTKIKNNEIEISNTNSKNENINAIIPLYINYVHYKVIYNNLKEYIGIIFTGHKDGYDKRLIRVFYKILADYIYYIYQLKVINELNDKEIILFLNYFRFCCEITKDKGYHKGNYNYVKSLSTEYKNNPVALEFLIAQVFCTGNIDLLEEIIKYYNDITDNKNLNFSITINILKNIINYFGSWTKFLNIFEENNGYFNEVFFIKNIDI